MNINYIRLIKISIYFAKLHIYKKNRNEEIKIFLERCLWGGFCRVLAVFMDSSAVLKKILVQAFILTDAIKEEGGEKC